MLSPKAIEGLAALGFAVGSTRGVVRDERYGCGAEFHKGTDGLYQMTILLTVILIHVHFAQSRTELAEDWRDRGLRFVTKMATRRVTSRGPQRARCRSSGD